MKQQQGATLITVLVILLIITILGTIAVKSGILGLKIATNSQVNALLLESSDAALFNVENPSAVESQLAATGMFGYFDSVSNANDQLIFCYRASDSQFYSRASSSSIENRLGSTGYCTDTSFATGRSAVLTQVYLTKAKAEAAAPLSTISLGTSGGQSGLPVVSKTIGVTVISVLPSFSGASESAIKDCFKESKDTVATCFDGLGVPYNMQHADYTVGGSPALVTS